MELPVPLFSNLPLWVNGQGNLCPRLAPARPRVVDTVDGTNFRFRETLENYADALKKLNRSDDAAPLESRAKGIRAKMASGTP